MIGLDGSGLVFSSTLSRYFPEYANIWPPCLMTPDDDPSKSDFPFSCKSLSAGLPPALLRLCVFRHLLTIREPSQPLTPKFRSRAIV